MSKSKKSYMDKVHVWGRIWSYTALAVFLMIPVSISAYNNAWPPASVVFSALKSIILIYWTSSIVEVITYTPMLGAGGTYLGFVTGNITNLKMPCALTAMENAKVRANSEEGEVISTIAIGVSSIVTTVIIAAGVLLLSPVLPKLNSSAVFKAAFDQVLPALFGALGASYLKKHWRIAILPVVVGCVVLLFSPEMGVGTLIFITIVTSVLGAFAMFKLNWIK